MADGRGQGNGTEPENPPVGIVDGQVPEYLVLKCPREYLVQLSYIGRDCCELPTEVLNKARLARRLDLSFNLLSNLDGLDDCDKLEELIVDNNELDDSLKLPVLPKLHTLMLNKNRLKDLDQLLGQIKQRMPNLRYLSLLGNEACPNELSNVEKDEEDYFRYRLYVLHRLPQLQFLDSTAVKDLERSEAIRQGPYLRVVKPQDEEAGDAENNIENKKADYNTPYTPLPGTLREEPDKGASFGKCRQSHYGRHSEGNRFIKNSDL